MQNPFMGLSIRAGILAAILASAGMVLFSQGCVPPAGGIIIRPSAPVPPPPPYLSSPPVLYVIPGTYAYYAADINVDLFFYQGSWYRPYGGRWYRAPEYNGPWNFVYTNQVPPVLRQVTPAYRRVPSPSGRLPYSDVRHNWRTWERDRHWERPGPERRGLHERENQGQGRENEMERERYGHPENGRRYVEPERRPIPPQERRQEERREFQRNGEQPPSNVNENRERERNANEGWRRSVVPNERRGNGRGSEPRYQPPVQQAPPQAGHRVQPQREEHPGRGTETPASGNGQERSVRPGRRGPSAPAGRQATQPQVRKQKKERTPSKEQQVRKKEKNRKEKEDQDSGASQDGNGQGRDGRGQGKRSNGQDAR